MTQDDRPTLSSSEAAQIIGVSIPTITRMIQRGELEAYKLTLAKSSPLRIYKDSVEDVLERRKQQPLET